MGKADDSSALPEERFAAYLRRQPTEAERQRLLELRERLGIRANDALWDVMIALDYHLQLYAAIPRQIAEQQRRTGLPGGGPGPAGGAGVGWLVRWAGLFAAGAAVFAGLCVAAGYTLAGRGSPAWGGAGALGAILGAPAGWLAFVCLLPALAFMCRMGWSQSQAGATAALRARGWATLLASVAGVAACLWVLAAALRR